jgi:hypothetical protein
MATKKTTTAGKSTKKRRLRLIRSDDKHPSIKLKPGMKLEVISVTLMDPTLVKAKASAARLCGGTNTCVALVEV